MKDRQMRKNHLPSPADLTDRWCEITGDNPKEVRQRANKMREAGLMSDFRLSDARLTVEHVARFIIAMLASDQHIMAPQAALDRGALVRGAKVTSAKPVALWTAKGNLQNDLEYLLSIAKDRGPWTPCTLQVSQTHPYAHLLLFSMQAECAVHIYYGQRIHTLESISPPRKTTEIVGSVIWHMAGLLTDD
jgi:hypothetical protein